MIEESKEKTALEAQKKTLTSENNELKQQLSALKTELNNVKLGSQTKINDLSSKLEAQAKEISLLEVQDRKK